MLKSKYPQAKSNKKIRQGKLSCRINKPNKLFYEESLLMGEGSYQIPKDYQTYSM